jgi:hypothetical protein
MSEFSPAVASTGGSSTAASSNDTTIASGVDDLATDQVTEGDQL